MRTLEEQTDIIRRAGHRITQPRVAVLQVLESAEGALDAAQIHLLGRGIHPRLGRVSVYRTLDLLIKLGLVRAVHGSDGCHTYARAGRREGHYLVCQGCGAVQEFPCQQLDSLLAQVGEHYDFIVDGHLLQLDGLCGQCRQGPTESGA